jgi:glycosyltransferase involved in cell wall biosynthesis
MPYCKEIKFVHISIFGKIVGIFQALFSLKPLQVGLFYSIFSKYKVLNWFKKVKPDAVFVQLHRVAPYFQSVNIPKVLDFQDAFSMGIYRRIKASNLFIKPIYYLEYCLLKRYEYKLLDCFPYSSIISDVDEKWIDPTGKHNLQLVLNGVDLTYYQQLDYEKKFTLLFTGNMGYLPNIDAAEFIVNQIMPLVWNHFPEATIAIAGANPHARVQSLASERVIVTGFVEDLRDYYGRSKIFIAPMRIGSGLQNKLLEAMAMKIPSITSEIANSALKAKDGHEIMVCNSAENFADTIQLLSKNHDLCDTLSNQAFDFVKNNFNWHAQVFKLHQLITQAYEISNTKH